MKKIVWCFLIIWVVACSDPQDEILVEVQSDKVVSITLKEGESTKVHPSPLDLSLYSLEDSRCPENVMCIWAGEAATRLQVSSGINTREINLCLGCSDTNDSIEFRMDMQEYLLVLKEVNPYPSSKQPEPKEKKSAIYSLEQLR